jgi:Flp pilus assembly protein TadG
MTKKLRTSTRGQTLVEYALMLPLMLLILVMLFDLGRAVYYYSVIHNAAREGARLGIITPTATGNIELAARELAIGLDPDELSVASAYSNGTIRVIVTYAFEPATPIVANFLDGGMITLESRSTMRVEE